MSDADYQKVTVRMATEPEFAAAVRADPDIALAAYSLTAEESRALARLMSEELVGAGAGSGGRSLDVRSSRSAMIGIGGLAAVAAVGGGGYYVIHRAPTAASYYNAAAVDAPGRMNVDGTGNFAVVKVEPGVPGKGVTTVKVTLAKPETDVYNWCRGAVSGNSSAIKTVTLDVAEPSSAAAPNFHMTMSQALCASFATPALTAGSQPSQTVVTIQFQSYSWTYQPVDGSGTPSGSSVNGP
jgi:hypothetical protein